MIGEPVSRRLGHRAPGLTFVAALALLCLQAQACKSEAPQQQKPQDVGAPHAHADDHPAAAAPVARDSTADSVDRKLPAQQQHVEPSAQVDAGFRTFWIEFRGAMLAQNTDALRQLARFPIIVHGALDDDPTRKVPSSKLLALAQKLLHQPVGITAQPQSFEQYLRAHEAPPPDAVESNGKHARVADVVFALQGEWRWTEAYSED